MADELRTRARLTVRKSGVSAGVESVADFDASDIHELERQTIGVTSEVLNLGDVSDAVLVFIENLDATNFVRVRSAAAGADDNDFLATILPGEFCCFPPDVAALPLKLQADTAPVDVQYCAIKA